MMMSKFPNFALFYTKTLSHEVKARFIEHSHNEIDDEAFCRLLA